jgi:hypothetical protein
MGSSHRSKSTRAKRVRPGKRPPTHDSWRKSRHRSPFKGPDIPEGIREEIESQRRVLVTVITLLLCLHGELEQQSDKVCGKSDTDGELSFGVEAAVQLVYLPDVTAMLMERVHDVHLALDSVSLLRAAHQATSASATFASGWGAPHDSRAAAQRRPSADDSIRVEHG